MSRVIPAGIGPIHGYLRDMTAFKKVHAPCFLVKILDNFGVSVLCFIGFYLIFSGDVIERFSLKRTNFAEYSENVSELPTINKVALYLVPISLLEKRFLTTVFKHHGSSFSCLIYNP